jgi:predicted membrane protein
MSTSEMSFPLFPISLFLLGTPREMRKEDGRVHLIPQSYCFFTGVISSLSIFFCVCVCVCFSYINTVVGVFDKKKDSNFK